MFMVSGYCRRWYVYFKRGNSNSVSMLWYLWFYDNLTLGNTEKEVSNNLKSIYFPFFSNISNMKICDISIYLDFRSICKVKSTFHLIICSIYIWLFLSLLTYIRLLVLLSCKCNQNLRTYVLTRHTHYI